MHARAKLFAVAVALAVSASTSMSAQARAAAVQVSSVSSPRPAATQAHSAGRDRDAKAADVRALPSLAAANPCLCVNKPEYRHVKKQLGARPLDLTSLVHRFGTSAQGKDVAGQTYIAMVAATAKGAPKLKKRVPYPSYQAKSARKHRTSRYSVYWIFAASKGPTFVLETWKFGITRQADENRRPKSQYRACMKHFGTTGYRFCRHRILKRVVGWFPARTVEADYTLAYALNHGGRCPPGMPACV
jgi:hypothetical protein